MPVKIPGVFYVRVAEESRVVCGTKQPDKQNSSLPVLLICFDFKAAEEFFSDTVDGFHSLSFTHLSLVSHLRGRHLPRTSK